MNQGGSTGSGVSKNEDLKFEQTMDRIRSLQIELNRLCDQVSACQQKIQELLIKDGDDE